MIQKLITTNYITIQFLGHREHGEDTKVTES